MELDGIVMEVEVVEEAGYESALKGLGLSYKQDKDMAEVASKLADKDYGHNKFLESIYAWVLVNAPRYWWQEADTYRMCTKQSHSTMHTMSLEIVSGELANLFEPGSVAEEQMKEIESKFRNGKNSLYVVKKMLPEGFLQKRMWCMNYKCIRNIVIQRSRHYLPHWKVFVGELYNSLGHPELLPFKPADFADVYEEYKRQASDKD